MPEAEAIERDPRRADRSGPHPHASDVPLGAFLSGGMDSAAVLALMAQQSRGRSRRSRSGSAIPRTTSSTMRAATAAALRRRSSRAHRRRPTAVRVAETLALHYDEPFADASAIPTFYCRRARATARHRLPDRRRRRRAVRRLHAVRAMRSSRVASRAVTALRSASARARALRAGARARQRPAVDDGARTGAWFVWRRTVFPDYLLRVGRRAGLLRAAGALPERQAVGRHSRRPAARCCRGCSDGTSGTICPTTSS